MISEEEIIEILCKQHCIENRKDNRFTEYSTCILLFEDCAKSIIDKIKENEKPVKKDCTICQHKHGTNNIYNCSLGMLMVNEYHGCKEFKPIKGVINEIYNFRYRVSKPI